MKASRRLGVELQEGNFSDFCVAILIYSYAPLAADEDRFGGEEGIDFDIVTTPVRIGDGLGQSSLMEGGQVL